MGRQLLHNILIITFIHFRFIFTWTHWKRLLFNNLLSPNSVKVFFSRLIVSNFLQRENANLLSRSSCMHFINLSARFYFTNFFAFGIHTCEHHQVHTKSVTSCLYTNAPNI